MRVGGFKWGGRGQATASACAAAARESMHSDRSSPSPVLVWYMLIPARDHVVLNHRVHRRTRRKKKERNKI